MDGLPPGRLETLGRKWVRCQKFVLFDDGDGDCMVTDIKCVKRLNNGDNGYNAVRIEEVHPNYTYKVQVM